MIGLSGSLGIRRSKGQRYLCVTLSVHKKGNAEEKGLRDTTINSTADM